MKVRFGVAGAQKHAPTSQSSSHSHVFLYWKAALFCYVKTVGVPSLPSLQCRNFTVLPVPLDLFSLCMRVERDSCSAFPIIWFAFFFYFCL
jgi:hypothetical protein